MAARLEYELTVTGTTAAINVSRKQTTKEGILANTVITSLSNGVVYWLSICIEVSVFSLTPRNRGVFRRQVSLSPWGGIITGGRSWVTSWIVPEVAACLIRIIFKRFVFRQFNSCRPKAGLIDVLATGQVKDKTP